MCELYNRHDFPEMFRIEGDDITDLQLSNIDLDYDENEDPEERRKYARVLVRFRVPRKLREISPASGELDEEWEEIKDKVRVWTTVKYSFIRDFTPDVKETSDWIIEFMGESYSSKPF